MRSLIITLCLALISLLPSTCVALAASGPTAIADTTHLGIPWTRYFTTDRFGRRITFYVSRPRDSLAAKALPLVLVIEGSGCQSVWQKVGDRTGGSLQNLTSRQSKGRTRIMIVEKPGVTFLDQPQHPGAAEGASAEFLAEHTLERWGEANAAALRAALGLPSVDRSHVLVCGHSEGGTVAARVAALCPEVTHVAPLASGGPTQLFDLAEIAGAARAGDSTGAAAARRQGVYDQWAQIRADSMSTTRFWLGHPYRRWYTFASHDELDDLLRTHASIFIAHGTADASVPVVAFDALRAELVAHGRDVTVVRAEGKDHGYFGPEGPPKDPRELGGMDLMLGRVLDWFLAPS